MLLLHCEEIGLRASPGTACPLEARERAPHTRTLGAGAGAGGCGTVVFSTARVNFLSLAWGFGAGRQRDRVGEQTEGLLRRGRRERSLYCCCEPPCVSASAVAATAACSPRAMEPNSPKKIQFATPLFHSHLDPQAAEHKLMTNERQEVRGSTCPPVALLSPMLSAELQLVVEQHLQKQENPEAGLCDSLDPLSPITAQHYGNADLLANHNCPEPNGNEAHVNMVLGTEEHPGSNCAGGRELADACRAREERRDSRRSQHPQPHSGTCSEMRSEALPRRKDTPYQHPHPFSPGGKLIRAHTESFPEEEEGMEEQEVDRSP
ncbi:hypothetical protein JZ751_020186 [Albula glossodonta]|uniref:Uncharacterized protein n=1 Tax=Albula glossodonta TaxID=121402 RepID=A0A8T2NPI1_9TELE|nr:hypothetical protein JZ751_020186 [Albula glossodonta]